MLSDSVFGIKIGLTVPEILPKLNFCRSLFFAILRAFLKVSVFVMFEELPDAV